METDMRRYGLAFILSMVCLSGSAQAPVKRYALASAQHEATAVGEKVLQQGGNAVDAAVAMGYALAVVHPCCGGIGGGGVMTLHLANGKNTVIDYRETAPAGLTQVLREHQNRDDYLRVGVPGVVKGLNYALAKYGTWSRSRVMAPAQQLASLGYRLVPGDLKVLTVAKPIVSRHAKVSLWFPQGQLPHEGSQIRQASLARSLKAIAEEGDRAFYQGRLAKALIKDSKQHGGVLTLEDLKAYQVKERPVLHCDYRGYELLTTPPPFSGVTICQALKTLEAIKPNPVTSLSPTAMLTRIGILRGVYRDRAELLGDPGFAAVPVQRLLSPDHINELKSQALAYTNGEVKVLEQSSDQEGMHTTAYVVTDTQGNVASVTVTLNSYFGSGIEVPGTGIYLNNEMDDFSTSEVSKSNHVAPGKRPMSAMAPTIVMKDGRVVMALGSPGGSTIPTQIMNALVRVIDQKMSIDHAIDAARFYPEWSKPVIHVEPGVFSSQVEDLLRARGETLVEGIGFIKGIPSWGAVAAIHWDGETWHAAMDKRRPAGSAVVGKISTSRADVLKPAEASH